MDQRLLHITLNTGRITGPEARITIPPKVLQMLRPRVARLLKRPPGERRRWLGLPDPFFPFELNTHEGGHGPLFWVRWGGDKKALGRFAMGTNRDTDAALWELIHHLGRRELPRRPLTHPQLRAPWCTTVHHRTERLHDATPAAQFGALERGVTWAMVELEQGENRHK